MHEFIVGAVTILVTVCLIILGNCALGYVGMKVKNWRQGYTPRWGITLEECFEMGMGISITIILGVVFVLMSLLIGTMLFETLL